MTVSIHTYFREKTRRGNMVHSSVTFGYTEILGPSSAAMKYRYLSKEQTFSPGDSYRYLYSLWCHLVVQSSKLHLFFTVYRHFIENFTLNSPKEREKKD